MRTFLSRHLRYYMVVGRDKSHRPHLEVGRASRIIGVDGGATLVPVTDGTCPSIRLTWGWSVRPQIERDENHIDLGIGRLWIEADLSWWTYLRLHRLRRGVA